MLFRSSMILLGILLTMLYDQVVRKGIGNYGSLREVMLRRGISQDDLKLLLNGLDVLYYVLISIVVVVGIVLLWIAIDSWVRLDIFASDWLRYLGIPLMGIATQIVDTPVEDYVFNVDVDFREIQKYVKDDYVNCMKLYEEVLWTEDPAMEKKKFAIMINLLAAIADEKGLSDRVEKYLLVKEIKAILYKRV